MLKHTGAWWIWSWPAWRQTPDRKTGIAGSGDRTGRGEGQSGRAGSISAPQRGDRAKPEVVTPFPVSARLPVTYELVGGRAGSQLTMDSRLKAWLTPTKSNPASIPPPICPGLPAVGSLRSASASRLTKRYGSQHQRQGSAPLPDFADHPVGELLATERPNGPNLTAKTFA